MTIPKTPSNSIEPSHTRTPCVGICSTTYGDLVCRGCKRFAHEIVQWNGYSPAQREAVLSRLNELRGGAVERWLRIDDERTLKDEARRLGVPDVDADVKGAAQLAYEVLRRLASQQRALADMGLSALQDQPQATGDQDRTTRDRDGDRTTRELLSEIDREFYTRSVAQYERSFHTIAE